MLESRKMAPYGSGRSPLGILYLGGKNCCSWHRLSPGAKVADHGRAAQAGGRPEKTESERLHRPSRTLTTSKTRAYSEFPLRNATPSVLHQRHIGRVLRSSCNDRGRRLASSRAREPRPGRCPPLWPGDLRNDGGSVAAAGADGSAA